MSMVANPELPVDVIEAIQADHKLKAIKRLRKHSNLGLKEAKSIVDSYANEHPDLIARRKIDANAGYSHNAGVSLTKKLVGFSLLCLLGFSVFLMVFIPIEIYKTIAARNWEPVEVRITTSRIKEISRHFLLELTIEEVNSRKRGSTVSVRYGDMTLSLISFGGLFKSTLYNDHKQYPVGYVTIAYRSPDGSSYVLEQNSIDFMLILFAIASIYPAVAVWKIQRSDSNKRIPPNQ